MREWDLLVSSAGNDGPTPGVVGNTTLWILTVAASAISRDFPSNVFVGSNKQYKGLSFNANTQPAGKFYPLINSMDVKAANVYSDQARFCLVGSLDAMKARKNCTRNEHHDEEKGSVVLQASGMGLILANPLNYSSCIMTSVQ
ncbi:subtilisin-like protease SBT5.3 [Populus nigra]|uniref:subtilisin-like protease SBT5.3 n=1 Tax=Populus nigra TaxID=3691 RepID=UPI002B279B7F|nr:subtilisin-like protease SBT5.3 [Populus nigra]